MLSFNNKPTPNACLRCDTPMVRADNEDKFTLYKYGLMLRKSTEVTYFVCPNCGCVEMRVDNPHIFTKK